MDFNIFAGAETGILKGVNINQKAIIQKNLHKLKTIDKDHEITAMSWGDPEEEEILLGLRGQTVIVFDTSCNATASVRQAACGTGPIVSLNRWNGLMITAVKSGQISVWKGFDKQLEINSLYDINNEESTLAKARQNPSNKNLIATVGKENPLQIWDLSQPHAPTFKAKNVRPDMLELRVPVWPTDAVFMPDNRSIATCTRHKQVRLYDPQSQRRPVISFEWEDYPLTCLSPIHASSYEVIVGAAQGRMARFDLRGKKAEIPVGIYKGFAGGVRDVVVHPTLPIACSVSLDRFMRIHHLKNHNILHKEYLKSRLNCVLMRSNFSEEHLPTAALNYKPKRPSTYSNFEKRRKIN